MPRSTREAARTLLAKVQEQGGYFTAKQAKESGYDYPHLEYHVSTGSFERVEHGLYRLTSIVPGESDDLIRLSLWSGAETVTTNRRQSCPTSRPWFSTTSRNSSRKRPM